MKKRIILAMLVFFGALSAGCATTPEEPPTAMELYDESVAFNNAANYTAADQKYEELISTYPTSVYSQQAVLDQIHSYYRRREYSSAVNAVNRFVDLYPDHPQIPYALYMKGVIYFRENRGILDFIGKQDTATRDPHLKRLSFEALQELLERYPDSKYAPDAAQRVRFLINDLARGEVQVANYYYKLGAYSAVIGRAKNILDYYPDSTSLEAAIVLLMNSYEHLGSSEASDDVRRLLELNFPDSDKLKQ